MERILPRATGISAPYWDGCRQGRLRLQYCRSCERHQFYPRSLCSHCHDDAIEWRDATGEGRVASFTVVYRGVSEAYPAPYVVALIDLEEGPRMMSHVIGAEPDAIAVDDRVAVEFMAWSDDVHVPVFRIVD